jgi:hypothetical protein
MDGGGGGGDHAYAPAVGSSLRNSYHPFSAPIVSPAVHEAARRMGEVSSFVGSLKDGMAETERWEGAVPRSFSERLAMEDWAEREGKGR